MRIRAAAILLAVLAVALSAKLLVLPGPSVPAQEQSPTDPLDALATDELIAVTEVLEASGHVDDDTRYHLVNLHEPPKSEILSWEPGDPLHRQAFVVVRQGSRAFEAVVDLSNHSLTSWREVEGAQPNLLEEEIVAGGEVVKSNPDWQAAMRRRGITDFNAILCTALSPGYYGIAEEQGRRLGKAVCFDLTGAENFWGRPIEGLTTLVDLDTFEVMRVIDTGSMPVPTAPVDYDERSAGPVREVPTSISIEQTEGPSFHVNGHEVSWQKWNFHFRIDPRVGLMVSRVRYADGGRLRSVLYQGSLAELFVPYMDPDVGWYWRTYMDAGEYLVGASATPLEPGVDCPGNARYFDLVLADRRGKPQSKRRAACLFERYAGNVSWRHWDFLSGQTETRKKRDLVLRMVATIGNYDYTFDWTFQQDGTIRVGVASSGIEQVKAVASRTAIDDDQNGNTAYGRFVSEHTVAVNHDHFFNFRLDLDVDGTDNSFLRESLRTVALGQERPRRSVWILDSQIAQLEGQGKLRISLERPALWRVINPSVLGPVGYPVSYEIKPSANAVSLMVPEDFPQRRAGFIGYHLWVTPYRAEERYAAGDYPAQSKGGDGLPSWTGANRSIEQTDIVVWYTLGFHHVVRAEDWPVLPTSWQSFELRPFDFFAGNPALDLPKGR
ncbi:MAG: primary-amine oxidase [Acidobacteriota bacterium]